jgi:hypothetical protein
MCCSIAGAKIPSAIALPAAEQKKSIIPLKMSHRYKTFYGRNLQMFTIS